MSEQSWLKQLTPQTNVGLIFVVRNIVVDSMTPRWPKPSVTPVFWLCNYISIISLPCTALFIGRLFQESQLRRLWLDTKDFRWHFWLSPNSRSPVPSQPNSQRTQMFQHCWQWMRIQRDIVSNLSAATHTGSFPLWLWGWSTNCILFRHYYVKPLTNFPVLKLSEEAPRQVFPINLQHRMRK